MAAAGRRLDRGSLGGVLAVLVTAVLWGTTGTAATFAPDVGPLAIGAAALGIGGALQALIALPSLRRERTALASHRGAVLAGALGVLIYPLAFYSSMHWRASPSARSSPSDRRRSPRGSWSGSSRDAGSAPGG